jgi:hypothetical protein
MKFGHAVTIANAAKSAQIYPKTINSRNFKIPPRIEILGFFPKNNFHV